MFYQIDSSGYSVGSPFQGFFPSNTSLDSFPSTSPYSSFYNSDIPPIDHRIQQAVRPVHFLDHNAVPFYPQSVQERDIQGFNSGKITVESYLERRSHRDLGQIAPHLTKVVVGNAAVERLPEFPRCKVFICRNNTTLKEIPGLSCCEIFACTNCPNVESLPANLLDCHQFDCSDCPQIEELPLLPLAEIIKCYRCTQLKSLPARLESCLKLDCRGCSSLNRLSALPKCVSLLFEGAPLSNIVQRRQGLQTVEIRPRVEVSQRGKVSLVIDWDELIASPESILPTLSDCVRLNGRFPFINFSKDGEATTAIDIGGLSRQLLTILFEGLCGPTPKLSTFSINEGKILPVAKNKGEYNSWRAVGSLLRIAFKKEWTIGDQFDEGFFGGLSYLLRNNKVSGAEFLIALNPTYSFLKPILNCEPPTEDEKEKIRCFIATYTDKDLDDYQLPEDEGELRSVFVEAVRNLGDQSYSGVPYGNIYEAMMAVKEGFWSFGPPTAPETEQLKDRIQGVLTKEQIKSCLVFKGFKHNYRHVKRLLPKWVDQQDMATLTKFVETVTGSRTLPSTAKIRVERSRNNMKLLPVAHTCFKLIEMPPYISKKLLARRLATFMENAMAGTGFQIA